MNKDIKKHIRILAEKFNHLIEYDKDILVLKNQMNDIRIWQEDKYDINVSFNLLDKHRHLKVKIDRTYDVLIELLRRQKNQDVELNSEMILTIKDWINEEGDFARQQLENLKKDLKTENIKYRELGGNRYEVEFYDGILILTDDLCFASSNVIKL
ncbi:hypothetical protein [Psychroserpens sp. NJDZ02]|uniref:hypothetical protein n=1 Tax=Psychroserpens sp. NJDZ02 TaxID=2570561 RepID=UPI0010A8AE3E|nr:hypothetical protein [Psychroserpens sp. NJDZ02]QCE40948.1 hypothetical protein E9099_05790 [Psychroserpens sp. NJDZ02]